MFRFTLAPDRSIIVEIRLAANPIRAAQITMFPLIG